MKKIVYSLSQSLTSMVLLLTLSLTTIESFAQCGSLVNYSPKVSFSNVCSGNKVFVFATGMPVSKWIYMDNNSGIWNPTGTSADTLSNVTLSSTFAYARTFKIITSTGSCLSDTSAGVDVNVSPLTYGTNNAIKLSASRYTTCSGGSVKLQMMNQSYSPTQWLYRDNGGNWTLLSTAATSSLTSALPVITSTLVRDYRVIVQTLGSCKQDSSDIVTITVNPFVAGNNLAIKPTVTQTSLCGGSTANISVEWPFEVGNWLYRDAGNNAWQVFNSNILSTSDVNTSVVSSTTRSYRVILMNSNLCSGDTSEASSLPINALIRRNMFDVFPRITGASNAVCAGATQSFQLQGFTNLTWYYRDSSSGTWTNFGSTPSATLVTNNAMASDLNREVRVVINNSAFCSYDTTATISYKIRANVGGYAGNVLPYVSTAQACSGASTQIILNSGASVNKWFYRDNNTGPWLSASGGKTFIDNNTVFTSNTTRSYKATFSNTAFCRTDTTLEASVLFKVPQPGGNVLITPKIDQKIFCAGATVTGSIATDQGSLVSKWLYRDNTFSPWLDVPVQSGGYLRDSNTLVAGTTTRHYKALIVNLEKYTVDTSMETTVILNAMVRGNMSVTPFSTKEFICNTNSYPLSIVVPGAYSINYWIGRELSTQGWTSFGYGSASATDTVNSTNPFKTYRVILFNADQCKYDTSSQLVVPIHQLTSRTNNSIKPIANFTSICSGGALSLSTATPSGVTVAGWMFRDNSAAWKPVGLASTVMNESTGNTKVLSPTQRDYIVILNNNCTIDTSAFVTVSLLPLSGGVVSSVTPTITSGTYCAGNAINASVSGFSGAVQKWMYRENGGVWNDFNAYTNNSNLIDVNTLVTTQTGRDYRAMMTRTGTCFIDTSQISTVTIKPYTYGDAGSVHPISSAVSVCSGSTYTVSISGYIGSIAKWIYRNNDTGPWRETDNVSNTTPYTEANINVLTPTVKTYRAILITPGCSYDTTASVSITQNARKYGKAFNITPTSTIGMYCSGSTIPLTMSGSIGTGSVRKWIYMDNGNKLWIDVPASTSTILNHSGTSVSVPTIRSYALIVNNTGTCSYDTSGIYPVVINNNTNGTVGTTPTLSQTSICNYNVVPNMAVVVNSGSVVKWLMNTNNAGWTDFPYSTAQSSASDYQLNVGSPITRSYRALINNNVKCSIDSSNAVSLYIKPTAYGNLNSVVPTGAKTNSCYASPVNVSLAVPTGYSVSKWIYKDNNGPWLDFSGNSTSALFTDSNTYVAVSTSRTYRVILTSTGDCRVDSTGSFTVMINPRGNSLSIRNILPTSGASFVCQGNPVNLSVVPGAGSEVTRWIYSNNGSSGPWFDAYNSSNQSNFNHPGTGVISTTNRLYRAILTDTLNCAQDSTKAVSVLIKTISHGNDTIKISGLDSICSGTALTLNFTAIPGNTTVGWLFAVNGGSWQNFGTSTTSVFTDSSTLYPVGTTKSYSALVMNGTTCSIDTVSKTNPVFVKNKFFGTAATSVFISSTDTVCPGTAITLYTGGTVERWLYSDDNKQTWQVLASNANIYTTNVGAYNGAGWRYYRAIHTSSPCSADSSMLDSIYLRNFLGGNNNITPTTTTPTICAGSSYSANISVVVGVIQRWLSRDNSGPWTTFSVTSSANITDNNSFVSIPTIRDFKVISFKNCSYDTSNVLSITIYPKVSGTDSTKTPTCTSTSICSGNPVQAIAVAAGAGNTISQWLYSDNGGKWNVMIGGNVSNISDYNTVSGIAINRKYTAIINNASGTCRFDTTAKLAVTINPVIRGNSIRVPVVPATVCLGTGYTVTLSVASTSDTTITRWLSSTNNGPWVDRGYFTPSTVAPTSDFTSTAVTTMSYRALLFKSSTCRLDTTTAASVNISSRILGNDNGILLTGSTPICPYQALAIASVAPGSGNTVQNWLYSDNGGSWNNVFTASTTLSGPGNVTQTLTRKIRAMILKGSVCTLDTTPALTITINPLIYGIDTSVQIAVTTPKNICTGSAVTITASNLSGVTITGWLYRDGSSGAWNPINQTSGTISDYNTLNPVNRNYTLLAYKTASCRFDTASKNDTAFIGTRSSGTDTTIKITTPNSSVCTGTSISLTANGSGSNTIQQWLYSDNGGLTWNILLNSTSSVVTDFYTSVTSQTTRMYRILVKKTSGCSSDSSAILSVGIRPRILGFDNSIIPSVSNTAICAGSIVGINIQLASGTSILKWISSSNNGPWIDFATTGSTTVNDYNTQVGITTIRHYKAIILKTTGCSTDTSEYAEVTINPSGYGNQSNVFPVAVKSSVCSGTPVKLSVSGFNGSKVLQWMYKDSLNGTWIAINLAKDTITDSNTVTTQPTSRMYRALVANSSGCSIDTTGLTLVAINPIVFGNLITPVQASQSSICAGTPITLSVTPPTGYIITQWLRRNTGQGWTPFTTSTNTPVTDTNTTVTSNTNREYKVRLKNTAGCNTDSSASASVQINLTTYGTNLTLAPFTNYTTICSGTPIVLAIFGVTGSITRWLYRDSAASGWNVINSTSFNLTDAQTNVTYKKVREYRTLTYDATNCRYDTTGSVKITINPQLQSNAGTTVPTSSKTLYCSGSTISVNASGFINGGVLTGWLYSDNNGIWNAIDSSASETYIHKNTNVTVSTSRKYRALVFTGCTTDTTLPLGVVIDTYPYKPLVLRKGNSDTLQSSETSATYQWKLNGTNIPGATANVWIAVQNGNYIVETGNSSDCKVQSNAYVFVKSGLSEAWLNAESNIYPNPNADGRFNVELTHVMVDHILLDVHDVLGRLVFKEQILMNKGIGHFELSDQNSGVYFVTININGSVITKRVVLTK